jgi:hypothetical protein
VRVVIIHCRAYQKAIDQVSLGNNQADKQPKKAAQLPLQEALLPHHLQPIPNIPPGEKSKKNILLGKLNRTRLKNSHVPLRYGYRDHSTISSCLDPPYGKFYQAFISLAILEPIPNMTVLNVPSQGKGCSRL